MTRWTSLECPRAGRDAATGGKPTQAGGVAPGLGFLAFLRAWCVSRVA